MAITRLALCFAFAGSVVIACAAGGNEKTGGGSSGSGGSGGSGGSANCGASVICSPSLSYSKCTPKSGACYYALSTGGQVACTVANPCTATPDGGGGTSGTGGTSGSGGTGGVGGEAGAPPEADTSCTSIADAGTCTVCCEGLYMGGAKTYFGAWGNCLCGTTGSPGVCASECASDLCAGTSTIGAACNTCATNSLATMTSACYAPVSMACTADPNCVAFVTCGNGCM